MKKRVIPVLLAVLLLVAVIPFAVFAAAGTPTGSGSNFFGNGTALTIQAAAPSDATLKTPSGFTATGTSAYIVWTEGSTTFYCAVNSDVVVFGGSDGSAGAVSVPSTSVTMTGGTIYRLYGGNLGQDNTRPSASTPLTAASVVTGNVDISVTGGTIRYFLGGGGKMNTAVNGKVTMNISGASFGETASGSCYVSGGIQGNGKEGYINTPESEITSNAVVNEVVINYINSKAVAGSVILYAGGSGYTKVNSAVVTIGDGIGDDDTIADYVYLGGINGYVGSCSLTLNSDAKVSELSGTNRGYVNTANATIDGATVENLYTGAAPGCFSSDGRQASGAITGISWNVTDASGVGTVTITPNINVVNGVVEASLKSLSIENSDAEHPLEITTATFSTGSNSYDAVTENTVGADDEVNISDNVSITIATGTTITNNGSILNNGSLTNNGTIANAGDGVLENGETASFTGTQPSDTGNAVTKYYLTVENGSGSGTYAVGEEVNVNADFPEYGNSFKNWTSASTISYKAGSTADQAYTVIVMPAAPLTVKANYEFTGYDPVITSPAKDTVVKVKVGEKAKLSITATTETNELGFLWEVDKKDGNGFVPMEDATDMDYEFTVAASDNGTQYRCVVMNGDGMRIESKIFTIDTSSNPETAGNLFVISISLFAAAALAFAVYAFLRKNRVTVH